ncbi:MAG: hypothetical protein ABFD77_09140 [Thermotogota bacterium]
MAFLVPVSSVRGASILRISVPNLVLDSSEIDGAAVVAVRQLSEALFRLGGRSTVLSASRGEAY